MKVVELFENTRGQQVMQFLDYLNDRCPCKKTDKEHLQKFAAELFKDGWAFNVGPSFCDFIKGTDVTGKHRLVPPEKHSKGRNKDVVSYFYAKKLKPEPGGLSKSEHFATVIDIDYPDYMLEELKEIMSVKRD